MIYNLLLENKSEIQSKVLKERIFNMLDKTFVIPESFDYEAVEVTKDFIARMDLISKFAYGTDKYQDILCKLNGISNPFELNDGNIIIVPSISDINRFYYQETYLEKDPDTKKLDRKPIPKEKKEKRKPNEAVVGDKRYKIDKNRKVIVY